MSLNINKEIGKMLRKLREYRGLTQVQLAKQSGLSRLTILNIESGDANATVDSLVAISNVLNCTMDINFTPVESTH